jgi:hypothetical protein
MGQGRCRRTQNQSNTQSPVRFQSLRQDQSTYPQYVSTLGIAQGSGQQGSPPLKGILCSRVHSRQRYMWSIQVGNSCGCAPQGQKECGALDEHGESMECWQDYLDNHKGHPGVYNAQSFRDGLKIKAQHQARPLQCSSARTVERQLKRCVLPALAHAVPLGFFVNPEDEAGISIETTWALKSDVHGQCQDVYHINIMIQVSSVQGQWR